MSSSNSGGALGARCSRGNGQRSQRSHKRRGNRNREEPRYRSSHNNGVDHCRFPGLPLDTYHVTATAPGFKSAVLTGVVAQIQNLSALSITLQVGTQTESITVDAGAPHVEAESSEMGGIVTEKQVIELPSRWEVLVSSAVKAFKVLVAGNNGAEYGKSQLFQGLSRLSRSENGTMLHS